MSEYVVWLDSAHAQIFRLGVSGIEKKVFKKSTEDHHTQNKKDRHHDSNEEHFFRDLAIKLKDAEKLLIFGPGLGKKHFMDHLQSHHTNGLAKKIIGMEDCDHPTDNQILAEARHFFEKYNLFHSEVHQ